MNIEEILDMLDELLDRAWNLPLSGGRCVIDAEKVREMVDDIRLNLPDEIKQAKAIVKDRTEILSSAKSEAEAIVRKAEERARVMIAQDEVMKQAQAKAAPPAQEQKPKKEKPRRPGGTKELEKQVAAAERAVAKAEERQYELSLKAEEVASNYLELQKVYEEQKALEEEIATLYTRWETLAAELEEAKG